MTNGTTMSMAKSASERSRPGDESGARDAVQNAVQWLARMTNSYATGRLCEDEGLQIYWDGGSRRFITPEVAPDTAVGLSLPNLVLQFEERGEPSPHPIDIEDKSSTQIEAWLLCEMLHRGFDRDEFSKELPYAWDRLMSGDEAKYSPVNQREELERLTTLFESTAKVLVHAGAPEGAGEDRRILCWPENLDIGFVVPREAGGVGIKVAFGQSKDGGGSNFVVQTLAGSPRTFAPLSLPLADIVRKNMTDEEVARDLAAMIKKTQTSAVR